MNSECPADFVGMRSKEEVVRVRVHCDEGVANHVGPEPCAGKREGVGEASVGVRAGQPLSREIVLISGADAVTRVEGNMEGRVIVSVRPARRGHRPWHVGKLLAREPGDLWIGHKPPTRGVASNALANSRTRGMAEAGRDRALCLLCCPTSPTNKHPGAVGVPALCDRHLEAHALAAQSKGQLHLGSQRTGIRTLAS
jgi:hypothetical protein